MNLSAANTNTQTFPALDWRPFGASRPPVAAAAAELIPTPDLQGTSPAHNALVQILSRIRALASDPGAQALVSRLAFCEEQGGDWAPAHALYQRLLLLQGGTPEGVCSSSVEVAPLGPAAPVARRLAGPFAASELGRYVTRLAERGLVSKAALRTAALLWAEAVSFFPAGRLPEPDAGAGENQSVMLAFDDGVNHLEFEILAGGQTEVFFVCRQTDEVWDSCLAAGDVSFQAPLIERLSRFSG